MPLPLPESRTSSAEHEALHGLINSDGWRIYVQAMEDRWSAHAYEREIREVTTGVQPGEDVTGIIQQINATYEGMRKMLQWPQERMRVLKSGGKTPATEDRFAWARNALRAR